MRVRDAYDADSAALDSLLSDLHPDYEPGSFLPSGFRSGTRTFVAESDDGVVVGALLGAFVDLGISHESCGYLQELVIDDQHRGEGIGECLVDERKAWLGTEGIEVGFVSTMPDGPRGFYERCGFRLCVGPWLVWSADSS